MRKQHTILVEEEEKTAYHFGGKGGENSIPFWWRRRRKQHTILVEEEEKTAYHFGGGGGEGLKEDDARNSASFKGAAKNKTNTHKNKTFAQSPLLFLFVFKLTTIFLTCVSSEFKTLTR